MATSREKIEEAFSAIVHPLAVLGIHGNEAEKELANKVAGLILAHNRGDTQPAAGEPIGKVELFGINMTYVEWRERKMPPLGTELYAAAPAAAHGDEAVRKDAARYRWLRKLERPHGDMTAPGEIGWPYVCVAPGEAISLCLERMDSAIDAAMRAQGDGEVQ